MIFIANIHFASRSDQDEYRIQCTGDLPGRMSAYSDEGYRVLVLGYYSDLGVFSAWDPGRFLQRNSRAQRFSMYTRLSRLAEGRARGFSSYVDSDGQNVLMFRPEFIGLYIENSITLHEAHDNDLQKLVTFYEPSEPGKQPRRRVTINKRRIQVLHRQFARSPQFREEVLSAYQYMCAICGVQLELIEAAHIVPHAHPQGLDVVENGVALCALHHKSFDMGLLYLGDDYSILMNMARINYLRKVRRIGGIGFFRRQLKEELILPSNESWFPSKSNIALGNELRGVGVT